MMIYSSESGGSTREAKTAGLGVAHDDNSPAQHHHLRVLTIVGTSQQGCWSIGRVLQRTHLPPHSPSQRLAPLTERSGLGAHRVRLADEQFDPLPAAEDLFDVLDHDAVIAKAGELLTAGEATLGAHSLTLASSS